MGIKTILEGKQTAKLEKLKITAYKDPKYTEKIGKEFVTLINPEKFTLNYKVEYIVPDAAKTADDPYYKYTPPSDLDVEFLFDDTGVFDQDPKFSVKTHRSSTGVEERIKELRDLIYSTNGDTHRPNYLWIIWGTLDFQGVLADLSVEYKLFAPDAKPLRAVARAKFKKFTEVGKKAAEVKFSSPDLTHARIVEEGETLPLMTKRIYGDSKYYLEVARVNKLTSFRKLKAGQQLFFPPIQKPE